MTRAEILDEAKKCITGKREDDYGSPEDNFKLIADFWNDYLYSQKSGFPKLVAKDVSMMMCLMKIARITTGTATDDSFIDLAGYAACGGEIVSKGRDKNAQI